MLKIRLRRMGSRHRPFYRLVVSDARQTPTASALEELGYYDPRTSPAVLDVKLDRVDHWVGVGAQLSDTVRKLVADARSGKVVPANAARPTSQLKKAAEAAEANAAEAAKAKAEAEAEAKAKAEADAKAKAEAEAKAKAEAEAKAKAKAEAEATAKAEAKAKADAESKAKAEDGSETEAKTADEPAEADAGDKGEADK